MIRIVLVEDQTMLRESLAIAIDSQDDMQTVSSLSRATEALDVVARVQPDLVLMDVCTEDDASGIAAAAHIKRTYPGMRVIVMTGVPEITFIEQAHAAGADSFVYKNVGTTELLSIIRSTMEGYSTFPAAQLGDRTLESLDEEEISILRLVCENKSRREIADELYMSEGTVKRRISTILSKTGYDSIMKLAVHAVSDGYIVPNLK
ncbi:MAG TPA: DNA-binding response regulator [Eggerthellaceae bacterium]|nr:DNA-binding response regulator [Eggerthellaceae bacterium]